MPDDICEEYSDRGVKLKIVYNKDDDLVIIEGDSLSLEFLGKLILSQASYDRDDGFEINPKNPGSVFFKKGTKTGLYIFRKENEKRK